MKNLVLALGAILALGLCASNARAQVATVDNCSTVVVPTGTGMPLIESTAGILCGLPGSGAPAATQVVKPAPSISTGYQQLTSLSAAASFTPPALTTYCLVVAEGAPLRFRADGTSPTASVGQTLDVGQPATFRMSIANLTALKFIQQSTGGIANVSCFKDS